MYLWLGLNYIYRLIFTWAGKLYYDMDYFISLINYTICIILQSGNLGLLNQTTIKFDLDQNNKSPTTTPFALSQAAENVLLFTQASRKCNL